MAYITIYIFICVLCIGEFYVKNRRQKYFLFFTCILTIGLFQSLRWRTGTDWESYFDFFIHANDQNRTELAGFEWGYTQLNILIRYISQSFTAFLFVECFLVLFFTARFAYSMPINNRCIVLLTSFALTIFPIRYTLASTIILCSYKYIIEKKILNFICFFILAILIHRSVIVFFPVYFFARKKFSITFLLTFYLVAVILGSLLESYFGNFLQFLSIIYSGASEVYQHKLDAYVTGEIPEYAEMSAFKFIISLTNSILFIIIFCYYRKKYFEENKIYTVLLNLYIFGMAFNRFFLFTIPSFARVTSLFAGGFIIMILMIISKYNHTKQLLLLLVLCFYYFVKYWSNINGLYADLYLPYYSIFSNVNRVVY